MIDLTITPMIYSFDDSFVTYDHDKSIIKLRLCVYVVSKLKRHNITLFTLLNDAEKQ